MMSIFRRNQKEARLIVFFTFLKFFLHLLANRNFGFHRDEFLYLALGEHPSWGYSEVPPFIAFISWVSSHLLGDSVFAVRLIPSFFSAMVIYLTGLMVLQLGGKRFAISVACLGMLLSPAFLASGYLLMPVVFDQFFWALSAFFLIKYIQSKKINYLYWIGVSAGFGMLNKYTIILYVASMFAGVLLSSQRKLIWNKHLVGAFLTGLVLFLPNLAWQISHDFPLFRHLSELKATQLNYVDPVKFVLEQFLVHATGILIWMPGFIYLFFSRVRSKFIFVSTAFLITMVLLTLLHGKVYYGFGAYPALFAAGGIFWQKILSRATESLRYIILTVSLAPALIFFPVVIPILPFNATLHFFKFTSEQLHLSFLLKWEDQEQHATTQDYADMLGWDEMVADVNKAYLQLNPKDRDSVTIFTENYGMAGAVDHLGKKYKLPKAVSFNSSYLLWAPDKISSKHLIYVTDETPDIQQGFGVKKKIGEVLNPYAREKGTAVYLFSAPLVDMNQYYRQKLTELRKK